MKHVLGKSVVFIFVAAIHVASLALAFTYSSSKPNPVATPTLQGVLLPVPPIDTVEAPKPQPVEKPRAKPTKTPEKKQPKKPVKKSPVKPVVETTPKPIMEQASLEEPLTQPAAEPSESAPAGSTVTPPTLDANPLNNPAPAYPKISRRLKEQGVVLLEILILPDGSVGEIRLKESSGYPRLDKTAIRAIKQWRYIPAREGDKPVEYWYLQALEFTLH